jgi:aminoglycoside phosphotransferase family enzyme
VFPRTARHARACVIEDQEVKSVDTHICVLLFAGGKVLKLRKPVRFDFDDFCDRDIREADCRP